MNTSSASTTTKTATTSPITWIVRTGAAVVAAGLSLVVTLSPLAPRAAFADVPTSKPVVTQSLYATSQWSTLSIDNPMGASQLAFDNQAAGMTAAFGEQPTQHSWTFSSLQQTSLSTINAVSLEVRFAQANWKDDDLWLEYSLDNWGTARRVATFNRTTGAPANLTTYTYSGLETIVKTPALANQLQFRFRVGNGYGAAETWTLKVDQVRLVVRGS